MATSAEKMDSAAVYELFETIRNKLEKQEKKQTESVKVDIDVSPIDAATERFVKAAAEANKPSIIEHQHRHKIDIDIQSNWFFFSWVALFFIIGALFWVIADQREIINEYKENDLKYRYVRMQGQTNEDAFTRLEHQFQYSDSIKIIRKQVERFEDLVKEQAERIERAKRNSEEAEKLKKELKVLKN